MKKAVLVLSLALLLAVSCAAAQADTQLTFTKGVRLDLFNENGVSAYLTGEVEDDGMSILSFPAVIVNDSDKAVCVSWRGTGNGWTISRGVFGNSGSNVAAHSRAKTFFWVEYEALDIKRFAELENVVLDFLVEEPYEGWIPTDNVYFTISGVTINFQGDRNAVREMVYYEESPSLAAPESFVDIFQSGHGSSSVNKKVTSINYRYRPMSNQDKAADILKAYVDALKNAGYTVSGSGKEYTVKTGSTKLATLSLNGDQITVDIVPGNDKLNKKPTPKATQAPAASTTKETSTAFSFSSSAKETAAADPDNPFNLSNEQIAIVQEYGFEIPKTNDELNRLIDEGVIDPSAVPAEEPVYAEDGSVISAAADTEETEERYQIGDTLKTDTVSIKLVKQGTADILYSYLSNKPSYWFTYEPQKGNRFLYIQGKFTNNGSRVVDINRLYLEAEFDGVYYDGMACGLQPDGKAFEDDVSPKTTVDCYFYFEVPTGVLNSYKTCTVKLGVDSSFSVKFRKNGGYDFNMCDSVFEIDLTKKASTGAFSFGSASTKTATAKPAAKATATPKATEAPKATEKPAGYDQPITFQNIPWGSTPDAARKALVKAGLIKSTSAAYGSSGASSGCLYSGKFDPPYELIHYYDQVLYEDWIYDTKIQKKIAGYTVNDIALDYVYSISKGKLNKKNPGLLSVNVTLKTPDEEAAKADLKNKLTSVYGPCASDNFFGTVWLGSDDTCVVLYDLTGVSIMYAKTDNIEVVSQMYTDLGLNADELDTSGL